MHNYLILGIESSCDDTSVSLVRGHKVIDVLSVSSRELQAKYGGVVPELAARAHEENFIDLVISIFERNNLRLQDVDYIAYTDHPGLIGCLLVGKMLAKTLSFLIQKPLIPVNHVYGHIFSVFIDSQPVFPHLALVVSGKTTALFSVKSFTDIEVLNSTSDNALGEVYDKLAREMGLEYPGGPKIDSLFREDMKVPSLIKNNPKPESRFSYSGILSASIRFCRSVFEGEGDISKKQEYVSTTFQRYVISNLIVKIKYWLSITNYSFFTLSGGVASNNYLQSQVKKLSVDSKIVQKKYSSDNAAMIAFYASFLVN